MWWGEGERDINNSTIFILWLIPLVSEGRTQDARRTFYGIFDHLLWPCSVLGGKGLTPAGCIRGGSWKVGLREKNLRYFCSLSFPAWVVSSPWLLPGPNSHQSGLLWLWLSSRAFCLGSGCTSSSFCLSRLPVVAASCCCRFQNCLTISFVFSASSITCVTNSLDYISCFKSRVVFLCLIGHRLMHLLFVFSTPTTACPITPASNVELGCDFLTWLAISCLRSQQTHAAQGCGRSGRRHRAEAQEGQGSDTNLLTAERKNLARTSSFLILSHFSLRTHMSPPKSHYPSLCNSSTCTPNWSGLIITQVRIICLPTPQPIVPTLEAPWFPWCSGRSKGTKGGLLIKNRGPKSRGSAGSTIRKQVGIKDERAGQKRSSPAAILLSLSPSPSQSPTA